LFLSERIKPFILAFQDHWDQVGLVFGFGTSPRSFHVTLADEEILFLRRGGERIRLSSCMWDGSARLNVARLVRNGERPGTQVTVGYHVLRIS